jgi:hypothetical protein
MFNRRHNKQNCPVEYKDLNDEEFLNYALDKF